MDLIIGIILLVAAVFLVISILFQSSKSHKMPGVISGGAETFFGKAKGKTIDRVLGKLTAIVAIVFCLLVIIMYVAQDQSLLTGNADTETTVPTVEDTTAEPADETTAEPADDTTAEDADETTAEPADDTTAEDAE